MSALPPALAECVEAIYATMARIESTLEQSRRDHETFLVKFAEASKQLEAVRRR